MSIWAHLERNTGLTGLEDYAAEDIYGGYHPEPEHIDGGWPVGSLFAVEGRVLYALVRALKPQKVIEFGTHHGCSATHIAQALADNGGGKLTCIDWNAAPRPLIPSHLNPYIDIVGTDINDYVNTVDEAYDMVFEDGMHDTPQVEAIWLWAYRYTRPGAVVVSHDALHHVVGPAVRAGIEAITKDAGYYKSEPSDCGLAIYRKPAIDYSGMSAQQLTDVAQDLGLHIGKRRGKAALLKLVEDYANA